MLWWLVPSLKRGKYYTSQICTVFRKLSYFVAVWYLSTYPITVQITLLTIEQFKNQLRRSLSTFVHVCNVTNWSTAKRWNKHIKGGKKTFAYRIYYPKISTCLLINSLTNNPNTFHENLSMKYSGSLVCLGNHLPTWFHKFLPRISVCIYMLYTSQWYIFCKTSNSN